MIIKINGTTEKPVILEPLNDYWGGIFIVNAPKASEISNTKILGTGYFKHKAIQLTGGINFYESDIVIDNCIFENSLAGDNLSIVKSNFKILNSTFYNSKDDAFDSDYSNGDIINNSYENIAGDAIDTNHSIIGIFSGMICFSSLLISPTTIIRLVRESPLLMLSLRGPDGITLLFPNSCAALITIIEKSF